MGAFTGEISVEHLKDFNINWAIIGFYITYIYNFIILKILGHSERREYFAESNETVGKKIARAIKNNLKVIGCFGEKL